MSGNRTVLKMEQTKQTKGTVVFTQVMQTDDRPHTFYILKDTFAELGDPENIEVVIENKD